MYVDACDVRVRLALREQQRGRARRRGVRADGHAARRRRRARRQPRGRARRRGRAGASFSSWPGNHVDLANVSAVGNVAQALAGPTRAASPRATRLRAGYDDVAGGVESYCGRTRLERVAFEDNSAARAAARCFLGRRRVGVDPSRELAAAPTSSRPRNAGVADYGGVICLVVPPGRADARAHCRRGVRAERGMGAGGGALITGRRNRRAPRRARAPPVGERSPPEHAGGDYGGGAVSVYGIASAWPTRPSSATGRWAGGAAPRASADGQPGRCVRRERALRRRRDGGGAPSVDGGDRRSGSTARSSRNRAGARGGGVACAADGAVALRTRRSPRTRRRTAAARSRRTARASARARRPRANRAAAGHGGALRLDAGARAHAAGDRRCVAFSIGRARASGRTCGELRRRPACASSPAADGAAPVERRRARRADARRRRQALAAAVGGRARHVVTWCLAPARTRSP